MNGENPKIPDHWSMLSVCNHPHTDPYTPSLAGQIEDIWIFYKIGNQLIYNYSYAKKYRILRNLGIIECRQNMITLSTLSSQGNVNKIKV